MAELGLAISFAVTQAVDVVGFPSVTFLLVRFFSNAVIFPPFFSHPWCLDPVAEMGSASGVLFPFDKLEVPCGEVAARRGGDVKETDYSVGRFS